jgi:hypothetical protein
MELLRMLLSRCTALFRTRVLDKDLEDKLRSHGCEEFGHAHVF